MSPDSYMKYDRSPSPRSKKIVLRNEILEMVKNEIALECFYMKECNVILIRINEETINNPVLAEW